jgi:hypothetical protein
VAVDELRSANNLNPNDDRRLQAGALLRIPILHEGGISLKEQLALIDKNEAVAPIEKLRQIFKDSMLSIGNILSNKIITANTSTATHTAIDRGVTVHVHHYGNIASDINMGALARYVGTEIYYEERSRGLIPV